MIDDSNGPKECDSLHAPKTCSSPNCRAGEF